MDGMIAKRQSIIIIPTSVARFQEPLDENNNDDVGLL